MHDARSFVTGEATRRESQRALEDGYQVHVLDTTGKRHSVRFAMRQELSGGLTFGQLYTSSHRLRVFRRQPTVTAEHEMEIALALDGLKAQCDWHHDFLSSRVRTQRGSAAHVYSIEKMPLSEPMDGGPVFGVESGLQIGIVSRVGAEQFVVVSLAAIDEVL